MGVHDFSSMVYSKGDLDGEQNLNIPELEEARSRAEPITKYFTDYIREGLSTDRKLMKSVLDDFKKLLKGPEPPQLVELLRCAGLNDESITGASKAILEVFVFPKGSKITCKTIDRAISRKKYSSRYYSRVEYEWDGWDFESDGVSWNYRGWLLDAPDDASRRVWKVELSTEEPDQIPPPISKYGTHVEIWVRNYSIEELKRWIIPRHLDRNISSIELILVAQTWKIDWRSLGRDCTESTRSRVWSTVRKKMLEEIDIDSDDLQGLRSII